MNQPTAAALAVGNAKKRKSVTFADEKSMKRRREGVDRHKKAEKECVPLSDDVFVRKIHARPINGKYALLKRIGKGGFGAVYQARDISNGEDVALKLEHRSLDPSILEDEAEICNAIRGLHGFPSLYWYGWHDDYKIMAFELLGPSLEDLLAFCGGRFSLKTAFMIMDQLLQRLEGLHSRKMLHRDIKPSNCLLGSKKNSNVIYLADFGLAQDVGFCDTHCQSAPTRPRLIGTTRYASINGHEGQAQSFKDDLESLGYMTVYFVHGRLPWQGLKGRKEEKATLVMDKKKSIDVSELCEGLPEEFAEYMKYVGQRQHAETPSCAGMRELLRRGARKAGIEYDNVFDWTILWYLQQERK